MNSHSEVGVNVGWLGIIVVLFGLLFVASHGNELLKQWVISPDSAATMGLPANCRADELEEEGLSLTECELMVSNIQIILASSPAGFRSFQLALSAIASLAGVIVIILGSALVDNKTELLRLTAISLAFLLLLDILGFISANNIGPLLRAQYLWPLLLWFAIHLCMLIAAISLHSKANSSTNSSTKNKSKSQ